MVNKTHEKLLNVLRERQGWEERVRLWYEMRHDGLRRRNKPFPGAADLHYALIDQVIEKLKPFYSSVIWSGPRLANFTSLTKSGTEAAETAADFFDYLLREKSNFSEEILRAIDWMLLAGRGIMQVKWNDASGFDFESINPLEMIVPNHGDRLEDCEYFARVKVITTEQYKRDSRFNQSILPRITGAADQSGHRAFYQTATEREGLTFTGDKDKVIYWEVYQKENKGWLFQCWSPAAPDEPLRQPFYLPYILAGKPMLPFVSLPCEIKDKGWYSPRGVAERLAADEQYICRLWNAKADHLAFSSTPLFTSNDPLKNTGNFRFRPGDLLPSGVTAITLPSPPISLDDEMIRARLAAEQRIQTPDFGVGGNETPAGNKTATEVAYIRALSSTGVDLKGKILARVTGELYKKTWALLQFHAPADLVYVQNQERKVLPVEALLETFAIEPCAITDAWNKQQRIQRALARYQALRGHPNINQGELAKQILLADDPRLASTMYQAQDQAQMDEAEDEALEIIALMNGYPMRAKPGENHALRIQIIMGKLQQLGLRNEPVDEQARTLLQQHLQAHVMLLKDTNPSLFKEFMAAQNAAATPNINGKQRPGPIAAEEITTHPHEPDLAGTHRVPVMEEGQI